MVSAAEHHINYSVSTQPICDAKTDSFFTNTMSFDNKYSKNCEILLQFKTAVFDVNICVQNE